MENEPLKALFRNLGGGLRPIRSYEFFVDITPQAKQSARFNGHAYTAPKKKKYVNDVSEAVKESYKGPVLAGAVMLTILYCFKRPEKEKKLMSLGWIFGNTGPADIDNLLKPVKDAMRGICYKDDRQVVGTFAMRVKTEQPGIYIRVSDVMESYQ